MSQLKHMVLLSVSVVCVTSSATDAPERASFKDGALRLDANSGILLTVENLK